MEKILRQFNDFAAVTEAECNDDNHLTVDQRFHSFMQLMEPYYRAASRLQRIYRTDDLKQRSVCDDWGIRL